jgi:VWA domain containing CoxE-like protein
VLSRVPELPESLADSLVRTVRVLRGLELRKSPSVAETIDWARTLLALGLDTLDDAAAGPPWVSCSSTIPMLRRPPPSCVSTRGDRQRGSSWPRHRRTACQGTLLSSSVRSDYGGALASLVERWPDAVGPRSSLLILGDGRTNYRDPNLTVLERLIGQARHSHWLNPEPRAQWGSETQRRRATRICCRCTSAAPSPNWPRSWSRCCRCEPCRPTGSVRPHAL